MNFKHDISTAEAIQRLKDDDQRLLRGASRFPRIQPEVLAELAKGQEPYAAILGRSDRPVSSDHVALRTVSAITQFSVCAPMRVELTAVTIKRNCRMGNHSDLTNEVFHGI